MDRRFAGRTRDPSGTANRRAADLSGAVTDIAEYPN